MLDSKDTQSKFTFINHSNGASGNFLARLCLILFGDYNHLQEARENYYHMHFDTSDFVKDGSELKNHLDRIIYLDFIPDISNKLSEFNCHVVLPYLYNSLISKWFSDNIKAFPKRYFDHYICVMHIKNPDHILNCIPNSNYIKIKADYEDFQQLSFNFVTKLLPILPDHGRSMIDFWCKNLNYNLDDYTDIRKIVWLHWQFNKEYITEQNNYIPSYYIPTLEINFKNITDVSIINRLIAFLEIENVNSDIKSLAADFIQKYSNSQKKIPWILTEDEYI